MKKTIVAGITCMALLTLLMFAGYCIGYQDAIHSAVLTAHTEYGYEITYHGQTYWYEYEINQEIN